MTEPHPTNYYRVGGHLFAIVHPTDLSPDEMVPSLVPFRAEDAGHGMNREPLLFTLHISAAASLPTLTPSDLEPAVVPTMDEELQPDITDRETCDWDDARCTIFLLRHDRHQISLLPNGETVPFVLCCEARFAHCTVCLPPHRPATLRSFALNNFLMMVYAFAAAPHHTLTFHASTVVNGGQGYLFLGRSGTGKSTHSRLWLTHIAGTRLLNDDNPVVRLLPDGSARVYGSPWSGKTPCYLNESYPVGGFVRLQQAPHNQIASHTGTRAFATLLSSCSCLDKDAAIRSGVVESVKLLAERCAVHHLQCLPDAAAAQMSYKAFHLQSSCQ